MIDTGALLAFLDRGGPALWAIAALSVLTLAVVLWKLLQLLALGVWSRRRAERLARAFAGDPEAVPPPGAVNLHLRFAAGAIRALTDPALGREAAREEIVRLGQRELARVRRGLRALDLVATIAPLIGLLGTVLGMIEAFRALEETGARADPAILAGGIWEALLTTAAGMAVAIPATVALTAFEGVADGVQARLEDLATRLAARAPRPGMGRAA